MKLAVVGSRNFDNRALVFSWLDQYADFHRISQILSGGARGVDSIAEQWANDAFVPTRIFKPDWNTHGKSAGMIRNGEIIANAEAVLAFWDGKSKGTWNSIMRGLRGDNIDTVHIVMGEKRDTEFHAKTRHPIQLVSLIKSGAYHNIYIEKITGEATI